MCDLKAIDLFAGIGGIRLGFEQAMDIKTVFVSELDINAQKTYLSNFNANIEGDITKVQEQDIPSFDICLAGFLVRHFLLRESSRGLMIITRGLVEELCFLT